MIRFPYTLQRWNSATEEWQTVSRCNARYDGKARFIESPNGKAIEYTYEVIMPANVRPIEENEEVRILDRHGKTYSTAAPTLLSDPRWKIRYRIPYKVTSKADNATSTPNFGSKATTT